MDSKNISSVSRLGYIKFASTQDTRDIGAVEYLSLMAKDAVWKCRERIYFARRRTPILGRNALTGGEISAFICTVSVD